MEGTAKEHKVAFAILGTILALLLFVAQQFLTPYIDSVPVPDVRGKDRITATILLRNQELEVVSDSDNTLETDRVWKQAPEPGNRARRGTKVVLLFAPKPHLNGDGRKNSLPQSQITPGGRVARPTVTNMHPVIEPNLTERVVLISHNSSWAGAEWSVDGSRRSRGQYSSTNFASFSVLPGSHTIRAVLPDRACEVPVDVDSGKSDRVEVNLPCS